MLYETLALFVCALLAYLYVYFTRNKNFWKDRGVPYEEPLLIFGSFKDVIFGKQHYGIMYSDLYKKFNDSPYVGYFKMSTPSLLIIDPDIVKDVLVNNFANFSANDFEVSPDSFWSANPFSLNGAAWKESRAKWISGITPAKIKQTYPNMEKRCNIMIQHIKECNARDPEVTFEGKVVTSNLFMDMIVSGVFGLEINSFKDNDHPFRKIINNFYSSTFSDRLFTIAFIVMPWLLKLISLSSSANNMEKSLLKIANELIALRNDPKMLNNEAYQSMMKINYQESNTALSVISLAAWIFGYLFDGTETSSSLVSFALYELGRNPDMQDRLLEELNEAAAEDGRISFEDLSKLVYLDQIVSETMRLYPPGVSMSRLCTQKPNMSSLPFDIPLDTPVTISIYGLHMDPIHFPEPHVFDPERFTEEAKNSRHKYVYLPFGEGPRICLGFKFAMAQVKLALATLIRNFEVRVSSKTGPHPLEIDATSILFKPVMGIWLTLHERTKN